MSSLTWTYFEDTIAKMPIKRTCNVTEAITPIVARISTEPAITNWNARGISKSSTLKSDEA